MEIEIAIEVIKMYLVHEFGENDIGKSWYRPIIHSM